MPIDGKRYCKNNLKPMRRKKSPGAVPPDGKDNNMQRRKSPARAGGQGSETSGLKRWKTGTGRAFKTTNVIPFI